MKLYYDTKKEIFIKQKSKTKSEAKILITAETLRANKTPLSSPGHYVSTIKGIDFYWDDLGEMLVTWATDEEIRVYHPKTFGNAACI